MSIAGFSLYCFTILLTQLHVHRIGYFRTIHCCFRLVFVYSTGLYVSTSINVFFGTTVCEVFWQTTSQVINKIRKVHVSNSIFLENENFYNRIEKNVVSKWSAIINQFICWPDKLLLAHIVANFLLFQVVLFYAAYLMCTTPLFQFQDFLHLLIPMFLTLYIH